jgi:tRNA(fMet)-specific endonuclease VapC
LKFTLDSNAVIALMKGHPGFLARLRQHQPNDFALSAIVAYELYYGAYKSQRVSQNLALVAALRFKILDFNHEDARAAGKLRATLTAAGTPIGPYDVLIAGQAWARDLTLITRNVREFQRVGPIRVENWEV